MKWAMAMLATCGAASSPTPTTTGALWRGHAISSAWGFQCAAQDRKVVCFPYREPGPTGRERPHRTLDMPFAVVETFATGRAGACAVSADGRVACWGAHFCDPYDEPSTCERQPLHELPADQAGYRRLDWSRQEVCVVDISSRVRCAPRDELRDGMTPRRWLERVPGTSFSELVSSGDGFCALSDSGDVWCWGEHWGRDFLEPFRVQLRGTATDLIANGVQTVCAIVNGAVVCWGRYPDREAPSRPPSTGPVVRVESHEVVPIRLHRVRGLPPVVRLMDVVGGMVALTANGAAWFWGSGSGYRDGDFDPARRALDHTPEPKRIVSRGVVDGFDVGLRPPCFALENGHLHCNEQYRGMGLEELVDRVCYFDGPESRAARTRGEQLSPPPSSTCQ